MASLRCYLCEQNPGVLRGFIHGWMCQACIQRFGMDGHAYLTDEYRFGTEQIPTRVTFEEVPCAGRLGEVE